jgi:hypothetical protein
VPLPVARLRLEAAAAAEAEEDAARVYNDAAIVAYGEFAHLNDV